MDARAWDERYAASELVWSATPNQFVASELADLLNRPALDVYGFHYKPMLFFLWGLTPIVSEIVGCAAPARCSVDGALAGTCGTEIAGGGRSCAIGAGSQRPRVRQRLRVLQEAREPTPGLGQDVLVA